MMNLPNDRQRDALIRIANALSGSTDESAANGDRIAYALERIAKFCEDNSNNLVNVQELPTVTESNDGQVLIVSDGVWTVDDIPESEFEPEQTGPDPEQTNDPENI